MPPETGLHRRGVKLPNMRLVSSAPSAAAPIPFVMPGESLSKYGGAPAEPTGEEDAAQAALPARAASSFKPATLIQSPIQWDGSGLLPGESLSKHRSRQTEPAAEEQAELAVGNRIRARECLLRCL